MWVLWSVLALAGGVLGGALASHGRARLVSRARRERMFRENRAAIEWEIEHPLEFSRDGFVPLGCTCGGRGRPCFSCADGGA